MADGIYIGMAGAVARAAQLESISDNLANAQTPGFKKSEPTFQAFLGEAQSPDQAFPAAVSSAFDLSEGATMRTEEKLDVTPNGGAFLAVQSAGGMAFTRAGHLTLDAEGRLTAAHAPLLDVNGKELRIAPGAPAPEIRNDGSVYSGEERIGKIATFKLTGAMERIGSQLMRPVKDGQAAPVDAGVRIGELELGNTSPLTCAVQLVSAQRHFESAMQSIQTYRKMDERTTELGRVR
ncbi:MAG: flagellar hook basal-body protein [Archangiaceae bacterium]|nr:flagellar hook basal-body protein [Archangiaceae bacterium]